MVGMAVGSTAVGISVGGTGRVRGEYFRCWRYGCGYTGLDNGDASGNAAGEQ